MFVSNVKYVVFLSFRFTIFEQFIEINDPIVLILCSLYPDCTLGVRLAPGPNRIYDPTINKL